MENEIELTPDKMKSLAQLRKMILAATPEGQARSAAARKAAATRRRNLAEKYNRRLDAKLERHFLDLAKEELQSGTADEIQARAKALAEAFDAKLNAGLEASAVRIAARMAKAEAVKATQKRTVTA